MTKLVIPSLAALTVAFSSAAFAADESYDTKTSIKKDDDGGYERTVTEESKDSLGTVRKKEVSTEVDVDNDGDKETTVKSKAVEDPKGLMNKTTVESESVIKNEDGKTSSSYKKKVNGKVIEEENKE